MEDKKPLSQYGIGPYYAASSFGLTAAALALHYCGVLPVFRLPSGGMILKAAAFILAVSGAILWLNAVFVTKIARHIRENELVTTGAYAWVRNPIYSAIMLVIWALLFWTENLLLLLLCPVYYLLMTVMVKHTEERWLADLYGEQYHDYCKRVNRCIPWPPKK